MRTRIITSLILAFFTLVSLNAQVIQQFHESYEINEVTDIKVDIEGEVEYVKWKGRALMVESYIRLENGSSAIMRHFLKKGRYNIISDESETRLVVESEFKNRQAIVTPNGTCDEIVQIKVFYPDIFKHDGSGNFHRVLTEDEMGYDED